VTGGVGGVVTGAATGGVTCAAAGGGALRLGKPDSAIKVGGEGTVARSSITIRADAGGDSEATGRVGIGAFDSFFAETSSDCAGCEGGDGAADAATGGGATGVATGGVTLLLG
jgi:hypothetical protein